MHPPRPHRRTDSLTLQHVGEEILVYDERNHQAYCLNSLGSAVWQLCDGQRTPVDLAAAATLTLGRAITEADVLPLLADLHANALLKRHPDAVAHLSRRNVLARLGSTAALTLPVIAAIAAPTAAQAYSGCVDCTNISGQSQSEIRTRQHKKFAAQQEADQQSNGASWPK